MGGYRAGIRVRGDFIFDDAVQLTCGHPRPSAGSPEGRVHRLHPLSEGRAETESRYGAGRYSIATLLRLLPLIKIVNRLKKIYGLWYEAAALSQTPAAIYPSEAAR
jgi:hypothetical protein